MLSKLQLNNIPRWYRLTLLVCSALGFLDASYLTVEHYLNGIVPCSIGSCEQVLSSAYAAIGSVPTALLGAIFYGALFLFVLATLNKINPRIVMALILAPVLSFLASLGLVYIQLFVLHAICLYCMGSATLSTIMFGSDLVLAFKK